MGFCAFVAALAAFAALGAAAAGALFLVVALCVFFNSLAALKDKKEKM